MRKPIKTSHLEIVNYWTRHKDECGLAVDWAEAHERCWRCGYQSRLERCHITPHSLGGLDTPSNLVLLCCRCHREAPNIADPCFMWMWFQATCVPFYDTYWLIRGYFEFEQMFGRRPFTGLGLDESQLQHTEKLLQEEMQNITIHFGEGHMNPSTIACVLAKVEERLTGKLPTLPSIKWGYKYALNTMGLKTNSLEDLSNNAV